MMELLLADASPGGRLLAGGVGGLLVLASGAMLISEFRFRCRGHAVPAKVLRYRTFLDSDGDTMHAAIFQFELGGAWFEVEDSFAFGRPAFPTGATVTLVPPAGHPEAARPLRGWPSVLATALLITGLWTVAYGFRMGL